MKVKTILCSFAAILLVSLPSASDFAKEEDLEKSLKDMETQIRDKLSEYDQDKQISLLQEAHKAITGNSVHFGCQGWETRAHKVLELRLQVLNKCFNERDCTYDLDNPPRLPDNVTPPQWIAEHQFIFPGMRPEDVKDPEARKQYEAAIAENNRKLEKYLRENGLQDIIEDEIYYITRYMKSVQEDPERQRQTWDSIDVIIKSEVLRSRIKDAFEEETAKNKDATHPR